MTDFLKKLEGIPNIKLEELEVGLGKHGMSLSANLDYQPPSLSAFLASLGLPLPGSSENLKGKEVSIALTYERSRGIVAIKGYATILKITINGSLQLGDFFAVGDFPVHAVPELDQVELRFELDKTSSSIPANDTTKGLDIGFFATFSENGSRFEFAGDYNESTSGSGSSAITFTSFGGSISSLDGAALDLGSGFPIDLAIKDLFIAKLGVKEKTGKPKSITVFGSDLSIHVDFDGSTLPVVGQFLAEAKFGIKDLRLVYTGSSNQQPINSKDLGQINQFLRETHVAPLVTARSNVSNNGKSPANFPTGFSVQGSLIIGENGHTIPLHSSFPSPKGSGKAGAGNPQLKPQTAQSPTNPTPVGKTYGPLTIQSAGLGMSNGKVTLHFSGSLHIGPLGLQLMGFELATPIDQFDPSVSLNGLGLEVEKPPLTLQGLFLEGQVEVPEQGANGQVTTTTITAYTGEFSVGYKQYGLTGIGSYATLPDGSASLFLYGFLGAPLGGPPFCFVTGVAAGFGYNRTMTLPTPETVKSHPLIQPVLPGAHPPDFKAMNKTFLPVEGAYWGAVGLRATSFEMVHSFVLLALRFRQSLEIDIIGFSYMSYPIPVESALVPAMVKVAVGLVARIIPERGIVSIEGALQPGSYVYNPLAHISGGFGLLTVAKDQLSGQWKGAREGAFVFTMGGYAPGYKVKPFYPKAARLQLAYQIDPAISMKAQAYFAITPQAMMAGGDLQANFQEGGGFSIHVYFTAGANFIIYWKPYHYKASMYAHLSVDANINVDLWLVTIHKSVHFDLGADLNLWGPSLSGHANVHVHVLVSFSVGVWFGAGKPAPAPIDWSEFSTSFLPKPEKILSLQISKGLVSGQSKPDSPVVNPKELELVCSTAIPLKSVIGLAGFSVAQQNFGIKPMANTANDINTSELSITLSKDGSAMNTVDLQKRFTVLPVTRNLPAALWQPAQTSGTIPAQEGPELMEGLLCGLEISAHEPTQGVAFTIPANQYDTLQTAPAKAGTAFTYRASFAMAS